MAACSQEPTIAEGQGNSLRPVYGACGGARTCMSGPLEERRQTVTRKCPVKYDAAILEIGVRREPVVRDTSHDASSHHHQPDGRPG